MVDDVGLDLEDTADGDIRVTLTSSSWVLHLEADPDPGPAPDSDHGAADQATILIGRDDETWDIWLRVPQATVRELAELAAEFPGA